jgi:hypothetical protein
MTTMSEPRFKDLEIDYYQSAYGATLRLATDEIDDLRTLNAIFRNVRGGGAIDLGSWPGTRSENVKSILLRNSVGRSQMKRADTVSGMESFEWAQDGEGWLESAELIEGMVDASSPGHQYLTREGPGDILVEVAFQEE